MLMVNEVGSGLSAGEDSLLRLLLEAGGHLTAAEAGRRLGASPAEILESGALLRERGFDIEYHPHRGYRLVRAPDLLLPALVSAGLGTAVIARRIHYARLLRSTNDAAGEMAEKGEEEGMIVIAEGQTAGRGRRERRWESPELRGIYLSVILRPPIPSSRISFLTLLAAISATEAIRECAGLTAFVKWPNDVLVGGRKVCGILTELSTEGARVAHAILGVGINVNQAADDFPAGLEATSLAIERGDAVPRRAVVRAFLRALDERYPLLREERYGEIADRWLDLSATVGRRVLATDLSGGTIEGVATGLDEDGCLLVRLDTGLTRRVTGGDVRLVD